MKFLDKYVFNQNLNQNLPAEKYENIEDILLWKRNGSNTSGDSPFTANEDSANATQYAPNDDCLNNKENDIILDNTLKNALKQYRNKIVSVRSNRLSSIEELTACQGAKDHKQILSTVNLSPGSGYITKSCFDLNKLKYSPRTHTATSTDLSRVSVKLPKPRPKSVFFLDNHVSKFHHAMEANYDVIENSSPKEDVGVVLTSYTPLEPEVFNYANGLPSVTISKIEDSVFTASSGESAFNFTNGLTTPDSAYTFSDMSTSPAISSAMSLTESDSCSVTSSTVVKQPTSARSTGVLECLPDSYRNEDSALRSRSKARSMSTCDLSTYKSSTLPMNESRSPRRLTKAGSLRSVFMKTARLFKRHNSGSKSSTPSHTTPESNEISYFDDDSQISENVIINNTSQPTESYYKSFEDLTATNKPSVNILAFKDKCAKSANTYGGDIIKELGPSGGVLQIEGYDISLHVAANPNLQPDRCTYCSGLRKTLSARVRVESVSNAKPSPRRRFSRPRIQSKSSEPQLRDHHCPGKTKNDRRIVVGLVDPHENLVDVANAPTSENVTVTDSFCIAGPAVRIEYRERNLFEKGAILQLSTNVDLKTDSDIVGVGEQTESMVRHFCKFSCLQSQNYEGPYYELPNCYRYGNTLQVSLDIKTRQPLGGDVSYSIFVVPIIKLASSCFLNTTPSNAIARRFYHIGIYGPDRLSSDTKCRVSISASGFTPTIVSDGVSKNPLRLLGSYVLTSHTTQGFHISLTTKSSILQVSLEEQNFLISKKELATKSRIDRTFTIKYIHSRSPTTGHNTRNFLVIFTGVDDEKCHVMSCKAPNVNRSDMSIPETSPMTFNLDYRHQWAINKHDIRLHSQRHILGSDRQVFTSQLGVALKSSSGKNRLIRSKWALHYTQGDYIPIVNNAPLIVCDKAWYIGYSRHNIGFIPKTLIHLFNTSAFYNWPKVRVTVGKLIEAMIKPVQNLSFVYAHLWDDVITNVNNWQQFSVIVQFYETFARDALTSKNKHNDYSLSSFYLNQYKIYCESGPCRKPFHVQMVRALLYLEEYDTVEKIIIDCCIATLATKINSKGCTDLLSKILRPSDEVLTSGIEEDVVITHPYNKNKEDSDQSVPAYNYLKSYCKSAKCDDATLALKLFEVEQSVAETTSDDSSIFGCIALLFSVNTLKQFDTKM